MKKKELDGCEENKTLNSILNDQDQFSKHIL